MQNSKTDVDFSTYRINELRKRGYDGLPIGVMIVGHTGAGKSSTINALFQKDVAAVGRGTDPKTKDTSCFSLNKYLKLHYPTPQTKIKTINKTNLKNNNKITPSVVMYLENLLILY